MAIVFTTPHRPVVEANRTAESKTYAMMHIEAPTTPGDADDDLRSRCIGEATDTSSKHSARL